MLYKVRRSKNLKWHFSWSLDLVWPEFEVKSLGVIFLAYKSDPGSVCTYMIVHTWYTFRISPSSRHNIQLSNKAFEMQKCGVALVAYHHRGAESLRGVCGWICPPKEGERGEQGKRQCKYNFHIMSRVVLSSCLGQSSKDFTILWWISQFGRPHLDFSCDLCQIPKFS